MNTSSLPQVSRLGAGCGRKEGIHLGAIARFALRQGRNQNQRTWPSVHPLWNFRAAVKGKDWSLLARRFGDCGDPGIYISFLSGEHILSCWLERVPYHS